MGKFSGEKARRSIPRAHVARYEAMMAARDKLRLATALEHTAARLRREADVAKSSMAAAAPIAGRLAVTDHAVLRFLERVAGINIAAVRDEISRLLPRSDKLTHRGEHGIVLRDGYQFLVTPGSVVSVLTPEMDGEPWLLKDELAAIEQAETTA